MAIGLSLINGIKPTSLSGVWAGAFLWLAFALLARRIPVRQRWQIGVLLGVGLISLGGAYYLQGQLPLGEVIVGNQRLITLLASVTFLSLLIRVHDDVSASHRGKHSLLRTLFGVHLFGSVINMTVLTLAGDHMMDRRGKLSSKQCMLLSRGLASVVFWSPFTAAIAAVLHYQENVDLGDLMLLGAPLAVFALILSLVQLLLAPDEQLAGDKGYPISWSSLGWPLLLVVIVLLVHRAMPQWPIISVVTACALGIPLLVFFWSGNKRDQASRVRQHVETRLPRMAGELGLFLSAGVLAVGLGSLVTQSPLNFPLSSCPDCVATLLVGIIIVTALMGIHPVAMVTVLSVGVKGMALEGGLLALAMIAGWGIAVAVSPLSGIGIIFQARYKVRVGEILMENLPYALWMLLGTWLWFRYGVVK